MVVRLSNLTVITRHGQSHHFVPFGLLPLHVWLVQRELQLGFNVTDPFLRQRVRIAESSQSIITNAHSHAREETRTRWEGHD